MPSWVASGASDVAFTPTGTIAATTVQAAIAEVATDAAAATATLTSTVAAIPRSTLTAPPLVADWTQLGSPTVVDAAASGATSARIKITAPGTAAASVKALYRALPAGTSWTVTIRCNFTGPASYYLHAGLMLREGAGSDKFATLGYYSTAAAPGNAINVNKYTNLTTAVPYVIQAFAGGHRPNTWFRVTRAASTLTYEFSFDGIDWATLGTSNVTTNLGFAAAPVEWGIFLDTYSATTYAVTFTVDHATEA